MQKPKEEGPPAELEAVVGKVRGEGENKFAVTYPCAPVPLPFKQGETITFSLSDWTGNMEPRTGQRVILSELHPFLRGWRALKACSAAAVVSATSNRPKEGEN